MKALLSSLLIVSVCSIHAHAQPELPIRIEAEDSPAIQVRIESDDSASGKTYVTSESEWRTLLVVPTPKGDPEDKISVWIRFRGLPIALKKDSLDAEGATKEVAWAYRPPADWEWRRMGTFSREELGERMHFMRGRGENPDGGLDAVFLGGAEDVPEGYEGIEQDALHDTAEAGPQVEEKETPVEATVRIDWANPGVKTSRDQFSLNSTAGARPHISSDPKYHQNMSYMGSGVLRYHKGVVNRYLFDPTVRQEDAGWIDLENKTWDREKIRAAFEAYTPEEGTEVLINIPYWGPWMDKDKRLNPEYYEAFGEYCAELVRIMNVDLKLGIKYFEITNERDFVYWRAQLRENEEPMPEELAKIFLIGAKAMKKVDPGIKTGGPSSAGGETDIMLEMNRRFAKAALPELDFFSFHGYATGTAGESDKFIYDKADWLGSRVAAHRRMLDEISPDRHVELHLNEYNIAWTWKINEPRMRNHKGAVFDSLFLIAAARNGADVTNSWNDQESTYGKMDVANGYSLRLGAHVFHYFNRWLVGQSVSASSDKPGSVVAFAVKQDARRSFVLVNRSGAENTVDLKFYGEKAPEGTVETARISEQGLEKGEMPASELGSRLNLPPHSVSFFSYTL